MALSQTDAAPHDIVVSRDRFTLRLSSHHGDAQLLGAEALRLSCRCAWCTRDRIVGRFPKSFAGITIADVFSIGTHALHIAFSDGHARGIFPWLYLQEIARGPSSAIHSMVAESKR